MKTAIFWFRRDLRLADNHGLYRALNDNAHVLPLFIFDTNILDQLEDKNDRRVDFINQVINSLNEQLKPFGSGIRCEYGDPVQILEKLITELEITAVYTNNDYEPYARKRDGDVTRLLSMKGIPFHSFSDQVIFEKDEILKNDGSPFRMFTPYYRRWITALTNDHLSPFPSLNLLHKLVSSETQIPSPESIGFRKTSIAFEPVDFSGLAISDYDKYRDKPSFQTTRIGIHLRFGTVSIREAFRHAEKNETWKKELVWREFFMMILWQFPHVVNEAFNKRFRSIRWENREDDFERWKSGNTGYPLVDAGMRELAATGHMHNRVRMIAASFLCKHLLVDYRLGESWFAAKLDDFELASNNGNWQWVAGTGVDAAPYFRIFNPEEQRKKVDPDNQYILKWIPEYGTSHYPPKMIEHAFARNRAISRYKEAIGLI